MVTRKRSKGWSSMNTLPNRRETANKDTKNKNNEKEETKDELSLIFFIVFIASLPFRLFKK